MIQEKTLEMKKAFEFIKQNTYEKKILNNTIPEALITTKKLIKRTDTKCKNSVPDQKRSLPEPDYADFATTRTEAHYVDVPHWNQIVTTAEKGTLRQGMPTKQNNNRTVKKLSEEVVDEANESFSELDETIHHIEEIKNIEEKQKHYTAKKNKRDTKKI